MENTGSEQTDATATGPSEVAAQEPEQEQTAAEVETVSEVEPAAEVETVAEVKPRKPKRKKAAPATVDANSTAPFWPLIRSAKARHVFSRGEAVAGKVQQLTEGAVVVDLFGKAQAVADSQEPRAPMQLPGQTAEPSTSEPQAQTTPPLSEEPLAVGDIFRGNIIAISESGHIGLFNRILDEEGVKQRLQQAREQHTHVQGVVYGFNRGGFDVLIDGVRAFCPARGMALQVIADPHVFIGQKLDFVVSSSKERQDAVIVSRRPILEHDALERAKEVIGQLNVGDVLSGTVTEVRDFGIFVDIGGVQGLVHASQLSYDRMQRPQDVANVGDQVEVNVLEVLEPQRKKERHERVSLSLKALQSDPWKEHSDWLREGVPRKGKVTKLTDFGAFVELAPAIEGLLHVSEFGPPGSSNPPVKEGEELDVILERLDRKTRRITLSRLSEQEAKAIAEAQAQGQEFVRPRQLKPGSQVEVRVTRTSREGAEVQVVGVVGKRGRGFISSREMGPSEGSSREKTWEPGNQVMVKVVRIDRDGALQCSRKGYLNDEEKRAVKDYRKEASKQSLGTLGDLLREKLGQ